MWQFQPKPGHLQSPSGLSVIYEIASNALANMIAAGRIYAWILSLPEAKGPRSEAAAAYNGGTRVRGTGDNRHRRYKGIRNATAYHKSFDQHREMLDKVDQSMKRGRGGRRDKE